jgi:hypothetical protein
VKCFRVYIAAPKRVLVAWERNKHRARSLFPDCDFNFSNLDGFGTKYLRNQYVSDLKASGYIGMQRPRGWPPNLDLDGLYAKMVTHCDLVDGR